MNLAEMSAPEIADKFGKGAKDTGNVKVQIALLTKKINRLSNHLNENKRDYDNKRTLLTLVGRRRRLLRYLHVTQIDTYRDLIKLLELRH